MYLALGKEKFVSTREVIGIFDLDITSQSYLTRQYLSSAEKAGHVINAAEDIPVSFIVCGGRNSPSVILSQTASARLAKKAAEIL